MSTQIQFRFCYATICYLKAKSIIITASVTLLNQWKGNIIDYTNLSSKDILLLDTQAMNLLRFTVKLDSYIFSVWIIDSIKQINTGNILHR